MAIIGKGQLSLLDLNDAIISGTAPTNPSVGTLWIDSSGAKQILKKWTGSAWEAQPLDLEQLDPDFTEYVSTGVSTALTNLGNLSSDDKVTASERQVIADKLAEILGTVPGGTTALPAVATVNTYTTGDYYQARKSATDAGLSTGDANYTALATAYTTLSTYLNGIVESGSYLWDVSEAAKDKVHTVVGTTFRSNWQAFYNALGNLQTRTAKRVADAKSEAQAYAESYAKSYRSQLVANGFADMASNKNFSGFVYNATEKVTGPGSFLRTAAGETRTDEFIKVEGDRTYRMAVSVKSSTTSNTHNIGIECYNAAGTSLGKRHMIRTSAGSTTIPSTTGWVHYEGVIGGLNTVAGAVGDSTFPAGTTQVKIWFNVNVGGVANSFYVADVSFALEQIEANKDYNGISMSADKGLVVESTRNTTTMSATKGIEIKRKSDNANVFSVDANTGDLNITGNITMTGGVISWDVLNKPTAQQVGAATPEQVSTAVNNITLGGRNYLEDSAKEWYTNTITSNSVYGVYRNNLNSMFEQLVNQEVTMSFDMKVESTAATPEVRIYATNGSPKYTFSVKVFNPTTSWARYTHTTTITQTANTSESRIEFYGQGNPLTTGLYIRNFKIEKGNKATDWSPSDGDINLQVEGLMSEMEVGGTNLLLQSETILAGDNDPGSNATTKTLMEENGLNFYRYAPTADSVGKNISVFEGIYPKDVLDKAWQGKDVTFSLRVRCSKVGAKVMFRPFTYNPGWGALAYAPTKIEIIADGRWQTMSYVFKDFPQDMHNDPTTGIVSFDPEVEGSMAGHTLDVRGYKIEFGNMVTDWAPAPNDITAPLKETKALTDAWKAPNTTEISGTAIKTGTLDAGKITTGTLNASLVSVTNLNAANIQTGTLDASKVTISSTTAGVTINSSGVVANNATTGVQVVMNSTTGFEIKKSGATVFTVNSDGSLVAKNITLQGGSITWGTGTGKITPPTATDVGAAVIGDITNAVNAVQVGGRNLFLHTDITKQRLSLTEIKNSPSSFWLTHDWTYPAKRILIGATETFTISAWVKRKAGAPTGIIIHPVQYDTETGTVRTNSPSTTKTVGSDWTYVEHTFTTAAGTKSMDCILATSPATAGNELWVSAIKVEKGNKATDWTPAPEEVDGKIDGIEVGGKNYVERLGGSEYEKTKLYSTDGNFTTTQTDANGKLWMKFTGASVLRINTIKLSPSTTYTWSFYVYTTGTDTVITTQQWHSSGYNSLNHTIGTTPRRIIITFTTPASATDVNEILHITSLTSADSYFFADFQLERGNKATDWKEAESYTLSKLTTALSDASSAKSSVQDMTSDLKVTPLEKNELKRLWDAIKLEYARINDLGVSLAVLQATRDAFTNAYNALNSTAPRIEADILTSMNTTYDFVSTTNRDTFRTQMNTYFTRREEMEKAIAEQQKSNTSTVTNKVTSWQSGDPTYIDGAKIYTGSITAGQIAANAITASKIKVGAVNLINDPFIENAALGTAGAATALSSSLWTHSFTPSDVELVSDATYGKVLRFRTNADRIFYTNKFAVDPNKAYRITVTVKMTTSAGANPTGSLYLGANMYGADGVTNLTTGGFYAKSTGTFSGGNTNPYFYSPGKGNTSQTTWKMIDTYVLPSAFYNDRTKLKDASFPNGVGNIMYFSPQARQMHIRMLNYNSSASYGDGTTLNDLYIASLQVTEVDAGTIVADNIVTGTLNAGLITVTNLNAGSITTGTLDASKITVSNLNAGSLTTGTLNANLVTITNLNASNINTGTLNAARINAGSLTADKLSFSNNVNLMVDGYDSFENCILPGPGARTSGMTISLDSTYSLDGLKSLKFQGTGTDNYVYLVNANNQTTYNIQVVPGKTYMVSFYAYATDSTTPIEGWVRRGDTGDHIQFRTVQNTVANQWTRYFGKVTIPTGCTRVSVRVDINVANKPVWFDCFKFEECLTTDSEPGPWAASSLTVIDGSNIKTGTIDASLIRTGTLDASQISVTNLNASSISSGTLSSVNISGATITGGSVEGATVRTTTRTNQSTQFDWEYDMVMSTGRLEATEKLVDRYTGANNETTHTTSLDYSGLYVQGPSPSLSSFVNYNTARLQNLRVIGDGSTLNLMPRDSGGTVYMDFSNGTGTGSSVIGLVGADTTGTAPNIKLKATNSAINLESPTQVNTVIGGVNKFYVNATTTTSVNNLVVNGYVDPQNGINLSGGYTNTDGNVYFNGSNLRVRTSGSFNNILTDKITWYAITFSGGATGFGTGNSYGVKDDGRVYFEAIVTLPNGLTAGTTIATLVTAARPSKQTYMPIAASSGQTLQFVINTNGTLVLNTLVSGATNVTMYGSYSLTPNR